MIRWGLVVCMTFAPGILLATANAPLGAPDLIVLNGHILTEDRADRIVEALAIKDGRITAAGASATLRTLANRRTKIIDLGGRTATPGLIDAHAHLADGGMSELRTVDLSGARDVAEVRRLLAARAARLEPGQWLLGSGWDEGKLAERRYLEARDLDEVSAGHPAWLEHTTGHYGVANSAALRLAGIGPTTPDPPAGTIQRNARGAPSGVLKEHAQDLVAKLIPEPTFEEWLRAIQNELEVMHREGMTGVKDPDIPLVEWDAYASLAREGRLSAHVCALFHSEPTLEAARALIARLDTLPRPPAAAAPNLVACGIKLYMDGSGGARTAWMYEDWHKNSVEIDTGNKGYPVVDPPLYREIVKLYNAAGIHVGTHAIGDRAIDWVVDSYAEALAQHPQHGLRHAIIHANTPTDHAIDLMADLEHRYDAAYPETQGEFMWWIGDNYAGNLGPARSQRLDPFATYLKHGIHFAGGSDYFVTPLPARYGIWASVARKTLKGTYGQQPFGTAEAISAADALKSYTIWAAHALFLEGEAGSLEPGKSADLAVWDRDPTSVPTDAIKDMQCLMTIFRGQIVFSRPESIRVTSFEPASPR